MAAMKALSLLPESFAYGCAGFLGRLFFRCAKSRQAYAMRMLKNAFPSGKTDRELMRIGRVATGNIFKVGLDMTWANKVLRKGQFADRIDTSELATNRGNALIGVTPHLGSWEVGGMGVAQSLGNTYVIVKVSKNPLIQQFLEQSRAAFGLHLLPRRGGIRQLVGALRAGHVVIMAVDQNQRQRGAFAPFFGEMASNERSAATLAVRHGHAVFMASGIRIGSGFRFKLVVPRVLEPEITGDREADIMALIRRINEGMEDLIRSYPEQYLWIHNRYKTQPEPAASPVMPEPEG